MNKEEGTEREYSGDSVFIVTFAISQRIAALSNLHLMGRGEGLDQNGSVFYKFDFATI
jgi:hypothetical protein